MAVICTKDVDTNLSTANGFWRVEAYQLNTFNATYFALTSTRTINVTFANAGNLKKVGLCFTPNSNTSTTTRGGAEYKSVTVTLKESGVTRASVTLTGTQIWSDITGSTTEKTTCVTDANWVTFEGFNYAVTTAAGVWTLEVTQSGAESQSSALRSSDGTAANIAYFAVCDNTVTASSGNDCVIADKVVTIDQTFTFKGVLSSGDTTRSICGLMVNAKTDNPDNTPRFIMDSPASSYTITFNGFFVCSQHSGMRIGTEASPIPKAQKVTFSTIPATLGTATNSGWTTAHSISGGFPGKGTLELWGEYPAVQEARLAGDIAIGATSLTTDVATGWTIGDVIKIGGQTSTSSFSTVGGGWDETEYTITNISGTTIDFSPAIATYRRVATGKIINRSCRGIAWTNTASTSAIQIASVHAFTRVNFSGVDFLSQAWYYGGNSGPGGYFSGDKVAYRSFHRFENCSFFVNSAHSQSNVVLAGYFPLEGIYVNKLSIAKGNISSSSVLPLIQVKTRYFVKCEFNNVTILNVGTFYTHTTSTLKSVLIDGLYVERMQTGNSAPLVLASANVTLSNSEFYNLNGGTYGMVGLDGAANCRILNCKFNSSSYGIKSRGLCTNIQVEDCEFGQITTNTYDVGVETGIYARIHFKNCLGNLLVDNTVVPLTETEVGTRISVETDNQTANVDYNRYATGNIYRTGTGLSDTTVRTVGGYAMRFEPKLTGTNLEWTQNIPTGDIIGKPMTVGVWMKINNSAYWAGTHQMPRITVEYDNQEATSYGEAAQIAGDWQFVFTTFTPTTSFGQATVTISAMSDATGSNAYVYFDDFTAPLPQGTELNLGSLDLWADALPVAPSSFASAISANDVWAADPDTFGAGTVGETVKKTKKIVTGLQ